MAGVERYAAEVRDSEPRYIKHPSTWLNGQCWADEPQGVAKPSGNGNGPPKFKDLGNGIVEADGLKMSVKDFQRKHGARAN